jgi:hypothetical protein
MTNGFNNDDFTVEGDLDVGGVIESPGVGKIGDLYNYSYHESDTWISPAAPYALTIATPTATRYAYWVEVEVNSRDSSNDWEVAKWFVWESPFATGRIHNIQEIYNFHGSTDNYAITVTNDGTDVAIEITQSANLLSDIRYTITGSEGIIKT